MPAGRGRGRPFVLAVGTLERRKNLPGARRRVRRRGRRATTWPSCSPVRHGDDRPPSTRRSPRCRRRRPAGAAHGPVDDATKAWLLHHAAVLAYPSLDEGFGFPLLEAKQRRVPVVATRAGSIPEVAGDGAGSSPVGDGDALAAALARVVTDDDRRAELVAAGHANVARFSWAATADALVDAVPPSG